MVLVLEQFVRNLRESRLISPEEALSLEKALQASRTPRTVEEVAKLLIQSGKLTEFQAAAISSEPPQSLILGEYVLLDILGKGGMGIVFRARHRLMDRIVALKTLPIAKIKEDSVQRFYREVKAAARLSHPNIVTAFDAGEFAGTHYLVMEYVIGRDLSAIVREKGPLPLRQAIDYVQQTARGLDYAHKHGVVHRDVKPSNLLLEREGVVKILDMGLARLSENLVDAPEAAELTGTGQLLGTVDYMSPEQAEDVRKADHLSDIYSLGCTLYFFLTRRPAYTGENIVQRILAHREKPIPSVIAIRPDCPPSLDALIQRMLAKRPEERPQSMAEIIVNLGNCLANPTAAPPPASRPLEEVAPAKSWLEELVSEEATAPITEDSQTHEATLDLPADADVHSAPPTTEAGGSATRHSSISRRSGTKKTKPRIRHGNGWKILGGLGVAAVLAGAIVAFVLIHRGGGSQEADQNESAAESSTPAGDSGQVAAKAAAGQQAAPRSAWEDAWAQAKTRADRLLATRSYAKATQEYTALSARFKDPPAQQRINEAIRRIEADADGAYAVVENAARRQLRLGQFAQGRAALQSALATYGQFPSANRARRLLQQFDQADHPATPQPEKHVPVSAPPAMAAVSPELVKLRQLDAAFTEAMWTIENRVTAWDFSAALVELQKVQFDSPELTARLSERRRQIQAMSDLQDRMITTINAADPPLQKIDLDLQGMNGDLGKSDREAIAATLRNGKAESLAWSKIGPKALGKVLSLAVRGENGGDWLAAGLLTLNDQDVQTAERCFDKAQSLGADSAADRGLLAARSFAAVKDRLGKHQYAESGEMLAAVDAKYGKLPWFAANKPELDAAAMDVKRGLREKDAERLYAQAAALFRGGNLLDLKPLVTQFETQYADSAVAADAGRVPSLAQMQKAVADIGSLVRVRTDGQGDAKTIQEAVNNAPLNAVIQIEEAGPWTEQIVVPATKDGLTICGKKGLMPVITTAGAQNTYAENLLVHASRLSLERLVIVRDDAGGQLGTAIAADKTFLSVRGTIVHGHTRVGKLDAQRSVFGAGARASEDVIARDCAFMGLVASRLSGTLQNVLVLGTANLGSDSRLRHCTITGRLELPGLSCTVTDSILGGIGADDSSLTIDHCDVYGEPPYLRKAVAGKACITVRPQFIDPKDFDYRLQPLSPCRAAASDGSDLGFSANPEVQALLKTAGELRNRARSKP